MFTLLYHLKMALVIVVVQDFCHSVSPSVESDMWGNVVENWLILSFCFGVLMTEFLFRCCALVPLLYSNSKETFISTAEYVPCSTVARVSLTLLLCHVVCIQLVVTMPPKYIVALCCHFCFITIFFPWRFSGKTLDFNLIFMRNNGW